MPFHAVAEDTVVLQVQSEQQICLKFTKFNKLYNRQKFAFLIKMRPSFDYILFICQHA